MFSKVFLICAFAFAASAFQIPYQGLEVPYEKAQYGNYHPFLGLIKSVAGSPYYKYPHVGDAESYVPEGEYPSYPYGYPYYGKSEYPYYGKTEYPYYGQSEYPYSYPPYVSSWLKYPYYAKFFQQYYGPISKNYQYPTSYYQSYLPYSSYKYGGEYSEVSPYLPYKNTGIPYSGYGGYYPYYKYPSYPYYSYPLLSKILGSYYTPEYPTY